MNQNLAYWLFGIGLFLMGLSYAIGFLKALSEQKLDVSKFMLATDVGPLKYPAVLIAFLLGFLIFGIGVTMIE